MRVSCLMLLGVLCFACQSEQPKGTKVILTAHRGASGLAPENTLAAMQKAIELGADYAELDIQELADGRLVLFHDDTLSRTTNQSGYLWQKTIADIKDMDAGSWFAPEFAGELIPTLEQVIDLVHGKMKLNIELKIHDHEKNLVESVVKLVQDKNFKNDCMITSFDLASVQAVKKLDPEITTGYIFAEMKEGVLSGDYEILSASKKLINPDFLQSAHKNGKQVHVWTVNDPATMQYLIEMGVDGIITDRPDLFNQLR